MGKLRKNKKGSLIDLIYIAGSLLTIAVIIIICFKVSNEFNTKISDNDAVIEADTSGLARNSFNTINNMYPGVLDNSFLILTIGLALATFVMAAMVRVHPMFLIFFIILLSVFIFVCSVFSNIYIKISNEAVMADVASKLVLTSTIMKFLPFIVGSLGCILAIVMYKNWENG